MTTRHCTTKGFFRQMPMPCWHVTCGPEAARQSGVAAIKATKPDALFYACLALPEAQRKPMDAAFQDIFELSCEKGFR